MFYHVSRVSPASSPDPRAQREATVAAIAKHIRDRPTVPADPADLEQPWVEASRVDAAVVLPVKHRAFRGCG